MGASIGRGGEMRENLWEGTDDREYESRRDLIGVG